MLKKFRANVLNTPIEDIEAIPGKKINSRICNQFNVAIN